MARKPAKSRDRLLLRLKMILVALVSGVTIQQRMLRDAFILDGDPQDDDGFAWNLMHSQLMLAGQVAVLASALEPFLRPKTRYKVGPEKYSFERVERQFGDSTSCEATFRFRAPDLRRLYAGLRFPGVLQTRSRHSCTGEEVFLYTLRRLSYPCTLSTLAWDSGRSISAQSEMFDYGITHIYNNFAHLRDGRSLECWARHFPRFAAAIHRGGRKGRAPLTNCIGYLDGSNQYVSHPHLNQGLLYNGHKRKHCVKWQGLMLPNGIMPMPFGPVHGSHHDSYIMDQSRVVPVMRRCCRRMGARYQLYGDPAYPQSQWVGGPFRHERLDAEEALFNARMSSTRISNEWGFGKIKLLWSYLDFENGQKVYLNDVQKYWPVAQILTNCHTCLYGSQTSMYFRVLPPKLEDYLSGCV